MVEMYLVPQRPMIKLLHDALRDQDVRLRLLGFSREGDAESYDYQSTQTRTEEEPEHDASNRILTVDRHMWHLPYPCKFVVWFG